MTATSGSASPSSRARAGSAQRRPSLTDYTPRTPEHGRTPAETRTFATLVASAQRRQHSYDQAARRYLR